MDRLKELGRWDSYKDQVCEGYNGPPIPWLSFLDSNMIMAIVMLTLSFVAFSSALCIFASALAKLKKQCCACRGSQDVEAQLSVEEPINEPGYDPIRGVFSPLASPCPSWSTESSSSYLEMAPLPRSLPLRPFPIPTQLNRGAYWGKRPRPLTLSIPTPRVIVMEPCEDENYSMMTYLPTGTLVETGEGCKASDDAGTIPEGKANDNDTREGTYYLFEYLTFL